MDNADVPQLEELITVLDRQLYEGYLFLDNFQKEFDKNSKKPDFDINVSLKKFDKDSRDWIEKVADTLVLGLDRQWHHYYHFVKPYRTALAINHPLGVQLLSFEARLNALEEIIVQLEEKRNLSVRKEIADKEHQADILYEIRYSEHTREIKLNNVLLARLNSDSKNANFFEYVYNKPNQPINVKDIEKATAFELERNIQDILRDLGFKGNIRKVFFPVATKDKVMFVNPVTKQYALKHDLPLIDIPNK